MTRRIVRTGLQLALVVSVVFFLIVFLDNRYRVLPSAIHNHLPAHHPGFVVTDVNIVSCSALNPFAKCAANEEYWHKIDKDLYLGKGSFTTAYLRVRRKREEELQSSDELVFDIKVGKSMPPVDDLGKDERWESRPMGIWVRRSSKRHLSDASNVVTGVDVLFGADAVDPRSNWKLQDISLFIESKDAPGKPRLTVRKGPSINVEKPVPRIRKDGKFKIMQAADLHLATGLGICREAIPDSYNGGPCEADTRTLEFVEKLLDEEKPDLIILSGDQVNGETAPDAQSAIYKYSALFARHKIPYAGIFGNHDDEGNLDRAQSMAIMDGLPYSLSTAGPSDVAGVGNYYFEILGRGTNAHPALTVYLFDSHSYTPNQKKFPGYDWIKQSQIDWLKTTAQSLKKEHQKYPYIHMDLAFIHIPLPEYRNEENVPVYGTWLEDPTAPGFNSHFKEALIEENILMVSCGHDHANDYCLPGLNKDGKPAVWMCYGGGAGLGGYGGYGGYQRRIRFFEFDMNEGRIRTWKRLECCDEDTQKRIDEQIIVDGGKVILDTP